MAKTLRARSMSQCIGCFTCMTVCATVNYQNHSNSKSAIHIKTSGGLSGKMLAYYCLGCREPACVEACNTGALIPRAGGGATLKKELCIGCGRCADACIAAAITMDAELRSPIICKHCGLCARFCPHGCLVMEEREDVEG